MSKPLFKLLFEGPGPTARRIDGMRDARYKGIRLSNDRDYLAGYAVAEAMVSGARRSAAVEATPPDGEPATAKAKGLVSTGYPAVSSFHS